MEGFAHSVFVLVVPLLRLPGMNSIIPRKQYDNASFRRLSRGVSACVLAVVIVLLAGCSENNPPYNDTPAITNVFPSNAAAGGPSFTMNITGTGFIAQSTAYWNNAQLTTTFNTNTLQLSATVPASDIATPGVAQVIVVSPAPGGGMSNAVTFTINPVSNPVPTITSLSPSSTGVGVLPASGVLLVNGTNFVQSSAAAFNGASRATSFVNATQLSVPLTAADVAANATISVTVLNPAPGGGVSGAASFVVGTGSAVRLKASAIAAGIQFPQVMSVNAVGGASNGQSASPAISTDGRFVGFYSTATNLALAGASGNIFVRDTCLGATDCTPQTIAVDLAPDGSAPNGPAGPTLAMSGDGRFVAFASSATNLLAAGSAALSADAQIYFRDLCLGANAPAGCVPSTQLASRGSQGSAGDGPSASPSISGDGRYLAFVSSAANLAPGGVGSKSVFVRDTCVGLTATSSCVPHTYSMPNGDVASGSDSHGFANPAISADGRYLAFAVSASSTPETSQILLADTCLGPDAPPTCSPSLIKVSVAADGSALAGVNQSPSISADGRFVSFASQNADGTFELFLRDTCLGASAGSKCAPSTSLLAENGSVPSISSAGRYVSYMATAAANSEMNPSPTGLLYVYDTCLGAMAACAPQAYAVNGSAVMSSGTPLASILSGPAPLSSDGSFVVFPTSAAIAGLPLSGLGDVLLSVTPF